MTRLTVDPFVLSHVPHTSPLLAYQAVWAYASNQLALLGCESVTFDVVAVDGVMQSVTFDVLGQVDGLFASDWFKRFLASGA